MAAAKLDVASAAKDYSRLGWALTPIQGKQALVPGWQRTQPLPPDDAFEIWAEREKTAPGINIGLVLGPSGIVDYEMDACEEDEFLEPVGGGIPPTPAFLTGSGKIHLLFRDPGGLTRSTRGGRELRAGGHQSVLPPSVHPDTKRPYSWIPGHEPWTVEPMALPHAVIESFRGSPDGGGGGVHWREALGAADKLGEGEGRHASLISYLGRVVDTFDTEQQLIDAALVYSEMTQSPPYPRDVVETQAKDVWRRYKTVGELPPDSIGPLDAGTYLGVKQLSEVEMKSVQFVWRPFLQRSAFHLLVGQKGQGKGTLLAYWAGQMTNGTLEGGSRSVLWIKTEDSFSIDVLPRIIAAGGDPTMVFAVHRRVRLPQDLPYIEAFANAANVGLIVIDPIVGVIGDVDTNAEGPIVSAIGGLNDLADELDLMVIGVRHLGKAIERGALQAVLGSAAWVNTPRAVLGLAKNDKRMVLEILAGNRTGNHQPHEFRMVEKDVEGVDEPVTALEDKGASDVGVEEILLRPRDHKAQGAKEEIVARLEKGEHLAKSDLVKDLGVSERTIERVLQDLGDFVQFVPPPKASDGQIMPGFKWRFRKREQTSV